MTSPTVLPFDYTHAGIEFDGVIVSADADAPTVLVFHGMEGRSDAQSSSVTDSPPSATGPSPSTCSAGSAPAVVRTPAPPR